MSPEYIEDMLDSMKNTSVRDMKGVLSEVLTECMNCGIYTDLDLINMLGLDLVDLEELLDGGESIDQKTFKTLFSKVYNDLKRKKGRIVKEFYSEDTTSF